MSQDWVQDPGLGLSTEGHVHYISISTMSVCCMSEDSYFRQCAPAQRFSVCRGLGSSTMIPWKEEAGHP